MEQPTRHEGRFEDIVEREQGLRCSLSARKLSMIAIGERSRLSMPGNLAHPPALQNAGGFLPRPESGARQIHADGRAF